MIVPNLNEAETLIDTSGADEEEEEVPCVSQEAEVAPPGEFSVCDLVWGKVKSHPWWPGQIFDSSNAAIKLNRRNKDALLVAYFGDQTFAWNQPSSLLHFHTHFSQMDAQPNHSQSFRTAVHSALEEFSRRLQLALLCPCVVPRPPQPHTFNYYYYHSLLLDSSKLLHFLKELLAPQPHPPPPDRLQLQILHSQILAFYRFKGYSQLPQFHVYPALLSEQDHTSSTTTSLIKPPPPSTKNRKLSEFMPPPPPSTRGGGGGGGGGGGKHRTSSKRPHSFSQPPPPPNASTKQMQSNFKVGECIRRIASQLTGSPPILLKSTTHNKTAPIAPDHASPHTGPLPQPNEMLSQLCLAAQDPVTPYTFLTTLLAFFSHFRNSVSLEYIHSHDQHRFQKTGIGMTRPFDSNKTFDFEEMSDSYWTDMTVQSSPQEEHSCATRKRKAKSLFRMPAEVVTSSFVNEEQNHDNDDDDHDYVLAKEKPSRKYRKRKREPQLRLQRDNNASLDFELQSLSDHDVSRGKLVSRATENKFGNDLSPTSLLMSFTEPDSIPSEINLNKIFRRFGPLKESETEVLRDTSSAKVVFKKRTDAEIAFSSAAKFSIFGTVRVNYQIS